MPIIGLWIAIAGYALMWTGLANWAGCQVSIWQAFAGTADVSSCSSASASKDGQGGAGFGDPVQLAPTSGAGGLWGVGGA